ncbi:MAG: DoxX family protein [Candidatus Taylorbacteria bacterium]
MNKLPLFSPVILRIGISLVFLWFGISQLSDPSSWIGYVPDFITQMSHLGVTTIVLINGAFEIIFGSMLLCGFYTRFAALLLAVHMLDITYTVGFDAIGVRDFAISIATIAIFLNGMDWFSLDRWNKEAPARETLQDLN